MNTRLLITLIVAASCPALASAGYDAAYYSRMDGKKREALKAAAKECVQSHRRLEYSDLPTYWQYSDVYPELVDGQKRWWEMYSDEMYLIRAGQSAKSSFSANHMQREHSVPKSWWKVGNDVEYTPAYSDMWNLYPSDGAANMAKSNYPLGPVDDAYFDNGVTRVGLPVPGYGGGSGAVFEPADEYKGDFARGFFYMATVYDDISWAAQYDWMFTKSSYPTLQPWAYEMLLQWGRLDPVSQKEILRNDAVEISQGNRNPFVDFPELAEYIWGTRTSEVFLISEQGGQVTPPITGDPELTMPVNGEAIDFGQTAVGGSMTAYVTLRGGNFREALSVRVGGADKDMFNLPVRSIPASSINTTGEYLLAVEYTPASIGRHTATLGIYDGGMESTVGVTLIGEGCPVPQLSPVVALPPVDVTDYAYTAAWMPAPVDEAVDYYVIYRTRYLPDGAETDELEASGTSLRIEGRDPAVMETYQVCSSRLGFLSDPSGVITVETSGVDTLQADGSLIIGRAEGGIRIITDLDAASIDIHDAAGLHLGHYAGVAHGDFIPLTPGVYLVTSPALRRPVKIII
ncbi:MAG: endonuclease [Muribaculaceae bacterium]|nr:endonuclease [Muribaculaceae bacterium]